MGNTGRGTRNRGVWPQTVTCRICCFTHSRPGLVVALMATMRRDPTSITTKTYTTAKNAVVWVSKSTANTCCAWAPCSLERSDSGNMGYVWMNVFHV